MDSQNVEISRSLFIRTATDGQVWEFAGTADGGCVIVRAGKVVAAAAGTSDAVMSMLEQFFQATAGEHRPALSKRPAPIRTDGSANASAA